MKRAMLFVAIVLTIICAFLYFNSLTFKVQKAVWGKNCTVSAAVIYNDYVWKFNNKKAPLLSVFKYFIALNVLDKIERENLSINDKILVTPDVVSEATWSPMLKKYTLPFRISVSDLMKYMISESDNNVADILIEYVGGIPRLQQYLRTHWLDSVEISADEKMMNEDIMSQYLNSATPLDVISIIQLFREHKTSICVLHPIQKDKRMFLSDEYKKFLDKIMIETVTGEDKIKAGLPKGTVFGHKTGSSSRKPDGIKIADNDAGFVILPDGSTAYIAIFVTESKMTDSENAALIAQISKIIYDKISKKWF